MANFIATINFNDADEKTLSQLHTFLRKESFRKSMHIVAEKNRYQYERSGNMTLLEVVQLVLKAIRQTGKNYPFTVIKQKTI